MDEKNIQEVQTAQGADGHVQGPAPEAPELGDSKHDCVAGAECRNTAGEVWFGVLTMNGQGPNPFIRK